MLQIDGSQGEGGGQILRTALSLSCITHMPLHISNIRANRPNTGLARQHVAVCNALAKITNAKTTHLEVGSTELELVPGKISGGSYEFDIGSAGSTTLLAQALLPVLFFADGPSKLVLHGGTHVMASPTFDYFKHVFLPAISKFGAHATAKILSPGFYPKGGGKIEIEISPARLSPASFTSSPVKTQNSKTGGSASSVAESLPPIGASIVSCSLPNEVASRACASLLSKFPNAQIKSLVSTGHSPGFAVTLHSGFIGASALGRRGVPVEQIVGEAANIFNGQLSSGTATDAHLADQLPLYMALSGGQCSLITNEPTSHLHTNIAIIEKFLPAKFQTEKEGACTKIST
jgi:RNA 3'-terminal phosphate cyclase (ATP)